MSNISSKPEFTGGGDSMFGDGGVSRLKSLISSPGKEGFL